MEVYQDACANGLGNGHVGGKKIGRLANRVGMGESGILSGLFGHIGKIVAGLTLLQENAESSQFVADRLRRAVMALATQDARGDFPARVVEFQPLQAHCL